MVPSSLRTIFIKPSKIAVEKISFLILGQHKFSKPGHQLTENEALFENQWPLGNSEKVKDK